MSLREALRRATVARCTPQAMQHATASAAHATPNATGAQPSSHASTVGLATVAATPMQLDGCTTDSTDPRVTCNRCTHYRAAWHRCANHRLAGLMTPDIAPELAALKQHCPGHLPA